MTPYYLTLNLIGTEQNDFLLLCPMVPKARSNLRALCVVGCDAPNYGKIIVYTFPKGTLFFGPSQVDAMIDQDTRVSEQLTLWNQLGSQVERGRMIVLPIKRLHRLYPAGLSQGRGRLSIPQLKRLIICQKRDGGDGADSGRRVCQIGRTFSNPGRPDPAAARGA